MIIFSVAENQLDTKAKRLIYYREFRRLGTADMARLLDMDTSNYSKLESGQPIGRKNDRRIIERLGIDVDWWETGQGQMFTGEVTTINQSNNSGSAIGYKSSNTNASSVDKEKIRLEIENDYLKQEIERLNRRIDDLLKRSE